MVRARKIDPLRLVKVDVQHAYLVSPLQAHERQSRRLRELSPQPESLPASRAADVETVGNTRRHSGCGPSVLDWCLRDLRSAANTFGGMGATSARGYCLAKSDWLADIEVDRTCVVPVADVEVVIAPADVTVGGRVVMIGPEDVEDVDGHNVMPRG
jgi:hypothetical protein